MAQQLDAVGAGIGGIIVGKMFADIAQRQGSQQGVHDRVGQDIGVRMTQKALLKGDLHAAEDQLSSLDEAVHVISLSDSEHVYSPFMARRQPSARGTSSGVVIFRLSKCPSAM